MSTPRSEASVSPQPQELLAKFRALLGKWNEDSARLQEKAERLDRLREPERVVKLEMRSGELWSCASMLRPLVEELAALSASPQQVAQEEGGARAAGPAPPVDLNATIRMVTCKVCGCLIDDGGLCSFECRLDSTKTDEREPADIEIRVYQFVRVEPMPLPSAPATGEPEP